jgi:hypothetical protein
LASLIVALAFSVTLSTNRDAHALVPWMLDTMPSNSAGGNQAGLHFDDGTLAARDFTTGDGTAWLRGMLYTKGNFSQYYFRYMYWDNGNCRTRARLQVSLNGSTWYDDYDLDVNVLHLINRPTSTLYTQTLWNAGDWYYKTIGTPSTCNTGNAHSHLAMQKSSYVAPNFAVSSAVDTCWANGTECVIMPALNPKKHNSSSCPPSTWTGYFASTGSPDYKRSGTVIQPYECQTWSEGVAWGADSPVFRGSKAN